MNILIAGDYCPQDRVIELFNQGDYITVLGGVKQVISESDYCIVNLECPVIKGGERPIPKCGPNLGCKEEEVEILKLAGFDCVTLANNHFLDYGVLGVGNTIDACQQYGLDTVGGGRNIQTASKMLYKVIKGKTIAIINCCEHEFSIATDTTSGSNPLNPIQQYYAIKEAREKADFVLVIVHGGHEHYQLPSPRMQETYRFFVDAGADAVVNHHQHCYSGYEIYKEKPIFYGLGNFCFDWMGKRDSIWNEGYILSIEFDDKISFKMYPYVQCDKEAKVRLMNDEEKVLFNKKVEGLNEIIRSDRNLCKEFEKFSASRFPDMRISIAPYTNRLLKALCNRNILPSFITKKRKLLLSNYVNCESHRDVLSIFLSIIGGRNNG